MANRTFNQFRESIEKGVVELWAEITFGLTGAPTLVTSNGTRSKGIASVSRTSQGLFVVTLKDNYVRLLDSACTFILAAGSFPAAPGYQVTANAVTSTTAPTVTVQFVNAAGNTATDPGNGEEVRLRFALSNSAAI